jgi:hypothetical protein
MRCGRRRWECGRGCGRSQGSHSWEKQSSSDVEVFYEIVVTVAIKEFVGE